VLSELNTDSAEVILKTGYEYGQSRVIAGYHYQSDVDAARMAASACIVRLHADENFMKQLKKVRKELDKLRKQ
jgi:acid phosphatase (class A)